MSKLIKKILIANRGEIAVRVIRACRDMGIGSVAVYSECDAQAYHVRIADEAVAIGASPSSESYLCQDKIIKAAKSTSCDAIHPGYGFLSENAEFALLCEREGITFIGPTADSISLLGDKLQARSAALEADLPVLPGVKLDGLDKESAKAKASEIGYPVLIKAAAGGGGKGMRVVESEDDFAEAMKSAANEARSAFGDDRVFLEKFLTQPRHIEIQILCDTHGNSIYLGERECSIQRRHQKVIEEAPSPVMTEELRGRMGKAAVDIATRTGYVGAGTVEFLVDKDNSFYFLEVNTRLQVEHPVTEMVTGLDLVQWQILIAQGDRLTIRQEDIEIRGHAIECRIYAENPTEGFIPSTGKLSHYRAPAGPGIRVDSGVVIYNEIPIYYDPMIAKLVAWGADRKQAIARMLRALEEYKIAGVKTTVGFHRVILRNKRFMDGDLSTHFLEEEYPENNYNIVDDTYAKQAAVAAALDYFIKERKLTLKRNDPDRPESSNWKAIYRRKNLSSFQGRS